MIKEPSYLELKDGSRIAYHKTEAKDKANPTIIFVHGFNSDMDGTKALALEEYCINNGLAFIRFDCTGHGKSSGDFTEGTIGRWADDLISVIDELTKGDLVLIGSSMGGWLILLATLKRPQRVAGLVGIAAAPDFTENLIWNELNDREKEELTSNGICYQLNKYADSQDGEEESYPITQPLVEDARSYLLLGEDINITCPVRLVHGEKDTDVPVDISYQLKDRLMSNYVEIILSRNGDHRMSEPEDIALILNSLSDLLKSLSSND